MSVMRAPSVLCGAGEVPAVDADRRDENAAKVALERSPLAADGARSSKRFEVTLGEPEVPDRPDDPAILDVEGPVAGHAGDDRELGMDRVRVVEAGHEQAALETTDEVLARRIACAHR